jgi:hypothetical protein
MNMQIGVKQGHFDAIMALTAFVVKREQSEYR